MYISSARVPHQVGDQHVRQVTPQLRIGRRADLLDELGELPVVSGQHRDHVLVTCGVRVVRPARTRQHAGTSCRHTHCGCSGAGYCLTGDACLAAVAPRLLGPAGVWSPEASALVDGAAPASGGRALALDERLEPLEVGLDLPLHDAQSVPGPLDHPLGLELQDQPNLGLAAAVLEVDRTRVGRAVGRRPGDLGVRDLLEDRRVPLALHPADLCHPVHPIVVELDDPLDAAHELGELLELRPLVVRRAHGHADTDLSFHLGRHGHSSFRPAPAGMSAGEYPPPGGQIDLTRTSHGRLVCAPNRRGLRGTG
jgi:hypothetical protein